MKKFISKLAYVKLKDLLSIFDLIIALPVVIVFKISLKCKKKDIWLICEKKNEACDNGYVLFKYIRDNHPEINVYYAINKKSKDYFKVNKYGNVINYGGIVHWIYYLLAEKNISSHKDGKPNAAICYLLEVYGILKNKRIFLQHGITLNDSEWIYYKNTKMRLFICGAKPEFEFVRDKFGYPKDYVKYLGFSRFDELHNNKKNLNQIVFMPTWRNWIGLQTRNSYKFDDISDFKNTEYFKKCNELLCNKELVSFLESNNINMYFYPHRNMQKFISEFESRSKNIIISKLEDCNIQDLIKDSALMITDYSSVSLDFAYMKKPVVYFQFDIEKFRDGHLGEGYFDYIRDGFGPVCQTSTQVCKEIIASFEKNFKMDKSDLDRHNSFFEIYDNQNSRRIYEAIKEL